MWKLTGRQRRPIAVPGSGANSVSGSAQKENALSREHGGWTGSLREYGAIPLDFSASVSPLGLPEAVRRAAADALQRADRYPDPLCRELRARLAARYGIPAEQIVCGGGVSDLIWRLALAVRPRTALIPVPAFGEYEAAVRGVGGSVRRFPLWEEEDFHVTDGILRYLAPEPEILFLGEPENPAGVTTDPALLRRVLKTCRKHGTLMAVDESFLDFLPHPERVSLAGELRRNPHLVVFRSFTKFYGMAGLRLGYALCGSAELARAVHEAGQPWAVSTQAQAAGLAALDQRAYGAKLRRLMKKERPILQKGLARLGCRVIPGEANYLLFSVPPVPEADRRKASAGEAIRPDLASALRQRGILIRDCAAFPGLGPLWYRTAVRSREENERLLQAVREVLSWR